MVNSDVTSKCLTQLICIYMNSLPCTDHKAILKFADRLANKQTDPNNIPPIQAHKNASFPNMRPNTNLMVALVCFIFVFIFVLVCIIHTVIMTHTVNTACTDAPVCIGGDLDMCQWSRKNYHVLATTAIPSCQNLGSNWRCSCEKLVLYQLSCERVQVSFMQTSQQ